MTVFRDESWHDTSPRRTRQGSLSPHTQKIEFLVSWKVNTLDSSLFFLELKNFFLGSSETDSKNFTQKSQVTRISCSGWFSLPFSLAASVARFDSACLHVVIGMPACWSGHGGTVLHSRPLPGTFTASALPLPDLPCGVNGQGVKPTTPLLQPFFYLPFFLFLHREWNSGVSDTADLLE